MKKKLEGKMLNKMFEVAKQMLSTSPALHAMLDSCKTEEERNVKLAIAVVRQMSKDIACECLKDSKHDIRPFKTTL